MLTKKELKMLLGKFEKRHYQFWNTAEKEWVAAYGRREEAGEFVAYCAGYLVRKEKEGLS
jgi:hypothetical protein